MKRNVIEIQEDKCIGCGLCAGACMQGAIEIIEGKAKLVSESYCDGLGMCLPKCPVDAIHMVEKDTDNFDNSRKNINRVLGFRWSLKRHLNLRNRYPGTLQCLSPTYRSGSLSTVSHRIKLKEDRKLPETMACGCPGTAMKSLERKTPKAAVRTNTVQEQPADDLPSELMQWPVQLRLVSPNAPYFENADLLVAADCTAYAYRNFHNDFIKDKVTLIGCPKLDDNGYNREKIASILKENQIKSITVVRMEVPCCSGIIQAVRQAMLDAKCIVPYSEVTIRTNGELV